jgi:hypothetical protein
MIEQGYYKVYITKAFLKEECKVPIESIEDFTQKGYEKYLRLAAMVGHGRPLKEFDEWNHQQKLITQKNREREKEGMRFAKKVWVTSEEDPVIKQTEQDPKFSRWWYDDFLDEL